MREFYNPTDDVSRCTGPYYASPPQSTPPAQVAWDAQNPGLAQPSDIDVALVSPG